MVKKGRHNPSILQHLRYLGDGRLEVSVKGCEMFHQMDLMKLRPPGKHSGNEGHAKAATQVPQ